MKLGHALVLITFFVLAASCRDSHGLEVASSTLPSWPAEPEPTCSECDMQCSVIFLETSPSTFDMQIDDAHAYSGYNIDNVRISLERDSSSWLVSLNSYISGATMYGTELIKTIPQPSTFSREPEATLDAWLVLTGNVGDFGIPCEIQFP